jgi:hypothetical protein
MPRNCNAPSAAVRAGGGGAANFAGATARLVSPKSARTPSESWPPNNRLKKQRKAKPIFK